MMNSGNLLDVPNDDVNDVRGRLKRTRWSRLCGQSRVGLWEQTRPSSSG